MNSFKDKLLKHIDKLNTYTEKLEYLNKCFLSANTSIKELIVLKMIEDLKQWGGR